MALNDVERTVVAEWFEELSGRWELFQARYPDPVLRPSFDIVQEDSLTYRLTKAHGDNKILQRVQERRKLQAGGKVTAHLDEFVGDLRKQVALHNKMKKQPPKTKAVERRVSIVSSASKRRRISPPPAMPTWPEAQVPMAIDFPEQGDVYVPQSQASYDMVGASYPTLLEYNAPSSFPADAPTSFSPPMPFDDPQPYEAPVTHALEPVTFPAPIYLRGTPRHAQRRPSPITVTLSPSRRRPSGPSAAVNAGVGAGRRRSSARLAARRASRISSAGLEQVVSWLEDVVEGGEGGEEEMDSLFGDFEWRVEEIE